MPADRIEKLAGATVQHGPNSNRIYLMKLGEADPSAILPALNELAARQGYTKIFAKVPRQASAAFLDNGYRIEATVPGFYNGKEDAIFLGRYFSDDRAAAPDAADIARVLDIARTKADASVPPLDETLALNPCTPDDVDAMADLYRKVFVSYPFPIHDPAYLRETMASHVDYFGIRHAGKLVALSSAEMDAAGGNVEMTDFATLPDWRGRSVAVHLLAVMESAMIARGIATAYTIARAVSAGMNVTFARRGYAFGGTLINNTDIAGRLESMNVWHKSLG